VARINEAVQFRFVAAYVTHRKVIEATAGHGDNRHHLTFDRQRLVLGLLQDFYDTLTAGDLLL
jgi:hypothetical protein